VKPAIPIQRLSNQRITRPHRSSPADIVACLGAVQAQEYQAAKWAIALRMSGTTRDEEIERAFDEGQILRTHVLRPTWHFVTPADIRWMLELTGPHVQRQAASYYRRHGLDAPTLTRAAKTIERVLRDGQFLSRAEIAERLRRARLRDGIAAPHAPDDAHRARGPDLQRPVAAQASHLCAPGGAGAPGDTIVARRSARRIDPTVLRQPWSRDNPGFRLVVRPVDGRHETGARDQSRHEPISRRADVLESGPRG
jgi:hypothetical protein